MKKYDKNNYFEDSRGRFVPCVEPKREPDYISYQKSFWYFKHNIINHPFAEYQYFEVEYKKWLESNYDFKVSSVYWYDNGYLIRKSDHWGACRDCYWYMYPYTKVGKIKFKNLTQNK